MKMTLQSDHMFLRKRDCNRSRGTSRLNEIIGIFYYAVLEAVRAVSLTRRHKILTRFHNQREGPLPVLPPKTCFVNHLRRYNS